MLCIMVLSHKFQKSQQQDFRLAQPQLIGQVLECAAFTARHQAFLRDVSRINHFSVHVVALFAALFSYKKTDARNERRNEKG